MDVRPHALDISSNGRVRQNKEQQGGCCAMPDMSLSTSGWPLTVLRAPSACMLRIVDYRWVGERSVGGHQDKRRLRRGFRPGAWKLSDPLGQIWIERTWTEIQALTLGLWNLLDRCVRSYLLGRHRNHGRCGELQLEISVVRLEARVALYEAVPTCLSGEGASTSR